MTSFEAYAKSFETRLATDKAGEEGDFPTYERGLQEQSRQAGIAQIQTMMRGGDPLKETSPIGAFVDPRIEGQRRLHELMRREQSLNQVLETGGLGDIQKFMRGVSDQYQAHNKEELLKKPKNEQEWIKQAQQMSPVQVDPNEVANVRQLAVKLDQQMKQIDPSFSFWTHPKTRKWGEWLNREAGGGQYGYFTSGEQPVQLGPVGTAAMAGMEVVQGAGDLGLNLVHGAWDLADRAVRALGGETIGPLTPTNYIEGPNGELIPNAGKVPDFMDAMTMLWAQAAGRNVEQAVAEMGATREMEIASRNGFQTIVLGASRIAGMGFGFGLPAGVAMNTGARLFGQLLPRGLRTLATQGTTRAAKITRVMSTALGAGLGNGMMEGVAYGRGEGYASAFLHGMAMAPVLMTLGALGRRTEWFVHHRLKMPRKVGEQLGAALEGVGFGAMETGTLPFLPMAWDFVKNPNEETWETYLKNVAGFMLFKGLTGRSVSPGQEAIAAGVLQARRGAARAQFAEKVARGEARPEEIAKAPADEAALRELGMVSKEAREAPTPEARERAVERRRQIEEEMDVRELGVEGRVEREIEAVEKAPEPTPAEIEAGKAETMRRAAERSEKTRQEIAGMTEAEIMEWGRENFRKGARPEESKITKEGKEETMRRAEERIARTAKEIAGKSPEEILAWGKENYQKAKELGLIPERREEPREPKPLREMPRWRERLGTYGPYKPEVAARMGREGPSGERAGPQSLQAPPTTQVEPTPGVAPVRASDIYLEMRGRPGRAGLRIPFTAKRIGATPGDIVQVPISGGKIGRKGVLGVFKVFENLVRTQEGRDLAVASHEWSHAMHRAILGKGGKELMRLSKEQMAEAIRERPGLEAEIGEILKDYPGAENLSSGVRWMEVWAEWHARNLLNEAGLDAKLPELSRFMRGWLAKPEQAELRVQYQRIQDMLYRYNAQGAVQRVAQSLVMRGEKPTPSEVAQRPGAIVKARDTLTRGFFDDMVELKRSQERWLKAVGKRPEDVNIMDDPARLYDALRMTARKTAEHFILRGVRNVPGLKAALDQVRGKEFEFAQYVASVRNLQLFKKGLPVQLPAQDYVETVKQLQRANPEFRKVAREMKVWTDALVDYVVEAGGLDVENAQRIKDAYVVYVPFFRAVEGPRQHAAGRGVAERGTGLSRIRGSTYEIRDPLAAMTDVATSMVAKAHQNMVMSALYKMSAGYEAGGIATVVPRAKVPKDHPVRQVLDALERQVELPGERQHEFESIMEALRSNDALNEQTVTLFSQKTMPTGERNVIAFTPRLTAEEIQRIAMDSGHAKLLQSQQGRLQWLEIPDPKIYESLMGIDRPPASVLDGPAGGLLRIPAQVLRLFATGLSPGFTVANAIRDILAQPVFSREGKFSPFAGALRFARGAYQFHGGAPDIREIYDELGVRTSSFFHEPARKRLIGEARTLMDKTRAAVAEAENFFATPENYLRFDEFRKTYERAKAEGRPEIEARMLALEAGREITVNFARAGIWGRAINQMTPYFNASLQGQRKMWGQILWGGDIKGDEAKARVQRAAVMNAVANITLPSLALWWLNKDEEWYQDLPEWRKVHYFNVKLGDTIMSLPKPFEVGVLFGSIPEAMADQWLAQGGNPAAVGELVQGTLFGYLDGPAALIPAALRASVEVQANQNFFTARPITPEWIARSARPEEQATFYTTEAAKVLSRALNGVLTPTEIEHWMGAHTAGTSTAALRMFDELMGWKEHPSISANPVATIASRFLKQRPHGQGRFVDQLYELSLELDQKQGSEDITTTELRLKRQVDAAKRQISQLRKSYREGRISREEAEKRSYQIARPLVEGAR